MSLSVSLFIQCFLTRVFPLHDFTITQSKNYDLIDGEAIEHTNNEIVVTATGQKIKTLNLRAGIQKES